MRLKLKNRQTRSVNLPLCIAVTAMFVFYLYIFACVPYTQDDFGWGNPSGIVNLLTANMNSRYTGNFIVVLLTRSTVLKTIFMAAVVIAIILTAVKLSGGKGVSCVAVALLINFLILTEESYMWRQTYGWVSGFANYVVSALTVMIYFALVEHAFEQSKRPKWYALIALAVFCLCSQMLLENVTLWLLATGILALILQ